MVTTMSRALTACRLMFAAAALLILLTSHRAAASEPATAGGQAPARTSSPAAAAGLVGSATFFNASATGSCAYDDQSPRTWSKVAISPNSTLALQTSPLGGCGMCLLIEPQCPDGAATDCRPASASIVAQVFDSCTACTPNQLNVEQSAYEALGGSLSAGMMAVIYRPVECQPPGNVTVYVTDYRPSDGGWLRLVLGDVAGSTGISSVELRQTPLAAGKIDIVSSSWRRMNNLHGASWELSGLPTPPLDLRITDGAHRQLLARKVIMEAGKLGLLNTTVQFPPSNSTAGMAASASAALELPEVAATMTADAAQTASESETSALTAPTPAAAPAQEFSADPVDSASLPVGANVSGLAVGDEQLLLPLPMGATNSSTGCNSTILNLLRSDSSFTILASLIETAGIEGALSDPELPVTCFAPTNSAWLTAVKQFPILRFDQDSLKNVLLQHIIVGKKTSADFPAQLMRFDTLAGGYLSIKANDGRLMVVSQASAGATLKVDVTACQGVVHAINSVLMPDLGRRRMRRI